MLARRSTFVHTIAAVVGLALVLLLAIGRQVLRRAPERRHRPAPATQLQNEVFSGLVIAVNDGDTITVLAGREQQRLRVAGIDCPELGQAFGQRARHLTSELSFGKRVMVSVRDHDQYGRAVAAVTLPDGRNLNRELVAAGLAWWYRQYSSDPALGSLEAEARAARRGLWRDAHPTPPWEWRRQHARSSSPTH
jgi:endonuclease YncB( thermonuclease family)